MRFFLIVVALLVAPMAWAGPPLDDDDSPGLGNLAGLGSSQDGPESTVIFVTDKGTQNGEESPLTLAGVTLATGSSIIVALEYNALVLGATATWNGQALTADVSAGGATDEAIIFSKHNVTGATGDVVVTIPGTAMDIVIGAAEVAGLTSTATDKTAAATGSGTSPSSGNTATISQDDELLFGAIGSFQVGFDGDPVGGTWSGSFTALHDAQSIGVVALSTGYRIVSSAAAYAAAKTGTTNHPWRALIATYKKAP